MKSRFVSAALARARRTLPVLVLLAAIAALFAHWAVAADSAAIQPVRIEFRSITPHSRWEFARLNTRLTKDALVWGDLLMPNVSDGQKVGAVVLSHGSSGIDQAEYDVWGRALNAAGYAVFVLDTFTPRGFKDTASDQGVLDYSADIADALNALRLLAADPRIDPHRIFHMGFSRGATTAFNTAWPIFQRPVDTAGAKFAGHISLYPGMCNFRVRNDDREKATASILMLLADRAREDWADVGVCQRYATELAREGNDVTTKEYKGAYHAFDTNGRFHYYQNGMTGKFCDMEVFITPVQGMSPGTGGYDFIQKKVFTTFAEMEDANRACVKHIPTRNSGDSSIQREAVADVLSFLDHSGGRR